jgi:hypothetical protein
MGLSSVARGDAATRPACRSECRNCRRELCAELDAPVYRTDDASQCAKCRRSRA